MFACSMLALQFCFAATFSYRMEYIPPPKLGANSTWSEHTSLTVLLLQTAAALQLGKLRCCSLFCLHQKHPPSNVKLFKRGVICCCPARFDVRRCNDTKGVGVRAIRVWTHLPTTFSDMYLSSTQSNGNWQCTPASSVFSFITNFCVYFNPLLAVL